MLEYCFLTASALAWIFAGHASGQCWSNTDKTYCSVCANTQTCDTTACTQDWLGSWTCPLNASEYSRPIPSTNWVPSCVIKTYGRKECSTESHVYWCTTVASCADRGSACYRPPRRWCAILRCWHCRTGNKPLWIICRRFVRWPLRRFVAGCYGDSQLLACDF